MKTSKSWKAMRNQFDTSYSKIPKDASIVVKAFKSSGLQTTLRELDMSMNGVEAVIAAGRAKDVTTFESNISKLGLDLGKNAKTFIAAAAKDPKTNGNQIGQLETYLNQSVKILREVKIEIAEERASLSDAGPSVVSGMIPAKVFQTWLTRTAPSKELENFASKSAFGASLADGKTKLPEAQAYQKKVAASNAALAKVYAGIAALQKAKKTRKEAAAGLKALLDLGDHHINVAQEALTFWMDIQSKDLVAKQSADKQQAVKLLTPLATKLSEDAKSFMDARDQIKGIFASVS